MTQPLSHLDEDGKARMVDVTEKPITVRMARAKGFVTAGAQTLKFIQDDKIAKGNPLETARLAGIMAAKQTAQLIPLCHPISLTVVDVQCRLAEHGVEIEASATAEGKTGVEMEALMAVSVAALTLYDMCKAVDRDMQITRIRLLEKSGGRSGHYLRKE